MTVFVVAHGAWSAGWAWKKMRPLLRAAGHEILVPSYTGLGARGHLAQREITLETHIQDVLGVLEFEDLRNVVLIGHSYGGIVATGVADRAQGRIDRLIYLDAFVPQDGQSLFDLVPAEARTRMSDLARETGEGWRVPSNPIPPDTGAADVAWITARRMAQPIRTFSTPLRLQNGAVTLPRSYIYCRICAPGDGFRRFAEQARSEPGWRCHEIDASHSPHITAPEALCDLLVNIAASRT